MAAQSGLIEQLRKLEVNAIEVQPNTDTSQAKAELTRWLSIQSGIPVSDYNANRQQDDVSKQQQGFRSIGRGFCGEVFELSGPNTGKAYKREHPNDGRLVNDYNCHVKIYSALTQNPLVTSHPRELQIPQVFEMITPFSSSSFWATHSPQWFSATKSREQGNILVTEQILPLPPVVRKSLIELYYNSTPEENQMVFEIPENKDCLIRVYLGRRQAVSVRSQSREEKEKFSLRNFPADLTILDELGLGAEKEEHAKEMARALAVMHWVCETDADDVEFVLGSPPPSSSLPLTTNADEIKNSKRKATSLWLLDFNNCSQITFDEDGVKKANDAFWRNDPYYPRPFPVHEGDEGLWEVFRESYLEESGRLLVDAEGDGGGDGDKGMGKGFGFRGLPERFVEAVEGEGRRRREEKRRIAGVGTVMGPPVGGPPRNKMGGGVVAGSSDLNANSGSAGSGRKAKKPRSYA